MTMATATAPAAKDAGAEATRRFFDHLLPPPRDFAVRLWDGSTFGGEEGARYTIVLADPGAPRRMFGLPVELALGEAYIHGDFDVEGDLYAAFSLKERARQAVSTPSRLLTLLQLRRALPGGEQARRDGHRPARLAGRWRSRRRDRGAISFHYDVGNDFYALWLGERMVYTCAYYPTGREDLDTAQERKLEHVCRKLRLRPGDRLLDVGCGWGGLPVYAAQHHGVEVLGVTLSAQQAEWAAARIAALGLEGQVEVRLQDYRDVTGSFDKVAAIGILEHIGHDCATFFKHVHGLLRPGGLFLNHAIGAPPDAEAWKRHPLPGRLLHRHLLGTGLIRERYVFPDGVLLPVSEANMVAERAGLEVRDVENLREHYALTLRHWVSRLEANRDEAIRIAGSAVYRTWRLYMASSALEFERGNVNLNQALFVKPDRGRSRLPLSREDLYRS